MLTVTLANVLMVNTKKVLHVRPAVVNVSSVQALTIVLVVAPALGMLLAKLVLPPDVVLESMALPQLHVLLVLILTVSPVLVQANAQPVPVIEHGMPIVLSVSVLLVLWK